MNHITIKRHKFYLYSRIFENISEYCETYSDLIPLSFVLGFYISIIMQRWWDQYCSIPWPDPIAVYVSSHIHGQVWMSYYNNIIYNYVVIPILCKTGAGSIGFIWCSGRIYSNLPMHYITYVNRTTCSCIML